MYVYRYTYIYMSEYITRTMNVTWRVREVSGNGEVFRRVNYTRDVAKSGELYISRSQRKARERAGKRKQDEETGRAFRST